MLVRIDYRRRYRLKYVGNCVFVVKVGIGVAVCVSSRCRGKCKFREKFSC